MGKRELVLIFAFVAIGIGIYRLTAPEAPPERAGFSLSAILESVRNEFRREDFKHDATSQAQQAVPDGVSVLAVRDFRGQLTIQGEDRPDVAATVEAEVYGADEAGAKALAEQLQARFETDGDTTRLVIDRPASRRRTRATLRLVVPSRLAVKVETIGRVEVNSVAGVQMDIRSGDVQLSAIAGDVRGDHRDGELTIKGANDVSITTRGSIVRLTEHRGGLKGDLTGGRLVARGTQGPIKIEARRTEMEIEDAAGALDVTASDGELTVRRPLGSVAFDGRRCDFSFLAGPAVALQAASVEAPLEATLPSGGVTLDLVADDGTLEVPADLSVTKEGRTQRTSGPVNGGGPVWKLRSTRDDIRVRR
jgi:hypothetical protein